MARDLTPAPGTRFADRYDVLRLVARSARTQVFEARLASSGRRVALRIPRAETVANAASRERFVEAARVHAAFVHPHVAAFVDAGEAEGVPFTVVEFLDGESLSAVVRREGRLRSHDTLGWFLPVASAVAAMHARGVLHGALSGDGVVLTHDLSGQAVPKLTDLGVAAAHAGRFVGAPRFLSPEVARGTADLDAMSDQWALAALLWESLAGRRLFEGERGNEILAAVRQGVIPPLERFAPGVDPRLSDALRTALAPDPTLRFATVGALARALLPSADAALAARTRPLFDAVDAATPSVVAATVLGAPSSPVAATMIAAEPAVPPVAPRAAPPSVPAPRRRRRWGFVVAGVGAVVVLGLGIAAALSGDDDAGDPARASTPATFDVAVRTEPLRAHIDVDGVYVSAGVLLRTFPRDGRMHTVRVYAPGFEPQTLEFANVAPANVVTLRPLAAVGATNR